MKVIMSYIVKFPTILHDAISINAITSASSYIISVTIFSFWQKIQLIYPHSISKSKYIK